MGIPYSREINAAFDQVTPLVASAYEVLETTKNIAVVLLVIQIIISITLLISLLALTGLLITLNPDLERERQVIVTPIMKWITSWFMTSTGKRKSVAAFIVFMFVMAGFAFLIYVYYIRNVEDATIENQVQPNDEAEALKKGKDVDAIKKGDTKQ